jgi:hypothetical protein
MYLRKFKETLSSIDRLKEISDPHHIKGRVRKGSRHEEDRREDAKGLAVYASDASFWVTEA